MTDPLLWLDGDPTDGRRARPHEPAAARPLPLPDRRRRPPPPRRGGRFRAALAGGLVSALLVGGGAFALGVVDDDPPAAPRRRPGARRRQADRRRGRDLRRRARVRRLDQDHRAAPAPASSSTPTARSSPTPTWSATRVDRAGPVRRRRDRRRARSSGVDRSSDLAVVKVRRRPHARRRWRWPTRARCAPGQLAVAIGSPFGLSQTTTAGIVSGTGRHIQAPDGFQIDSVIQTDAPINPGNSGGPLLDAKGRVIGVNSQIASQSGGSVGIGFAVPSNTVRDVIPRLERGETIKRAYLGVSTSARRRRRDRRRGVRGRPGRDGGPARRRRDRVRRRQAGRATPTTSRPRSRTAARARPVEIEVQRGGATRRCNVTLGERPANATP